MKSKRLTPEWIIRKLRKIDAVLARGTELVDAVRQQEISEQTYDRWRHLQQRRRDGHRQRRHGKSCTPHY